MAKNVRKKPKCSCGNDVLYGNLHCSVRCAKAHQEKRIFHEQELIANGFEQDPKAPNIYRKGGVAVTVERTLHAGLAKALEQHGHAVAQAEPSVAKAAD